MPQISTLSSTSHWLWMDESVWGPESLFTLPFYCFSMWDVGRAEKEKIVLGGATACLISRRHLPFMTCVNGTLLNVMENNGSVVSPVVLFLVTAGFLYLTASNCTQKRNTFSLYTAPCCALHTHPNNITEVQPKSSYKPKLINRPTQIQTQWLTHRNQWTPEPAYAQLHKDINTLTDAFATCRRTCFCFCLFLSWRL